MNCVVFTVADPKVGLGHLYRCDALASALHALGHAIELIIHSTEGQDWIGQRPPESLWRIALWKNELATVRELAAQHDTVIVDAYDIAPCVHDALQAAARRPVYFDDAGENIPERGVVINGSPGAHLLGYPERPGLVLLLGTEYQVLRRPFWTAPQRVVREEIKAVGVMLGGTDHSGLMSTVAAAVRSTVPVKAKVFAVGADPSSVSVAGVQGTGRLTASGIKALFDELDLLVTAAGQTVAEAVSCLLPTVMIQAADNQKYNVAGWLEQRCAVSAGSIDTEKLESEIGRCIAELRPIETRREMTQECEALSVWKSPVRLGWRLRALQVFAMDGVLLTPFPLLYEAELREVLAWRNDDRVRLWMDRPEIIPWEDHASFVRRLASDNGRLCYRVDRTGVGVGVINLTDISDGEAELGLYRNPDLQEKGAGALLMTLIEDLSLEFNITQLRLKVRHDNEPAKKLYKRLNYDLYGQDERYEYRHKELSYVS